VIGGRGPCRRRRVRLRATSNDDEDMAPPCRAKVLCTVCPFEVVPREARAASGQSSAGSKKIGLATKQIFREKGFADTSSPASAGPSPVASRGGFRVFRGLGGHSPFSGLRRPPSGVGYTCSLVLAHWSPDDETLRHEPALPRRLVPRSALARWPINLNPICAESTRVARGARGIGKPVLQVISTKPA
jgi:hypothetical protein